MEKFRRVKSELMRWLGVLVCYFKGHVWEKPAMDDYNNRKWDCPFTHYEKCQRCRTESFFIDCEHPTCDSQAVKVKQRDTIIRGPYKNKYA
nr:hypothetical protein 45 [Balneolaceae bacterium]